MTTPNKSTISSAGLPYPTSPTTQNTLRANAPSDSQSLFEKKSPEKALSDVDDECGNRKTSMRRISSRYILICHIACLVISLGTVALLRSYTRDAVAREESDVILVPGLDGSDIAVTVNGQQDMIARALSTDVSGESSFFVSSNGPYDDDAKEKFATDLDGMDESNGKFLVHVGSVQDDSLACPAYQYHQVANIFATHSSIPVFVTPGDNDWARCPDPTQSLWLWNFAFDKNFDTKFDVTWPLLRLRDFPEIFAMLVDGVLFMGLHTVQNDPLSAQRLSASQGFYHHLLKLIFKTQYRALVLFGNAEPGPEYRDFSSNVPTAYVHAGETLTKYRPYDDDDLLAISVPGPVRITVSAEGRFAVSPREEEESPSTVPSETSSAVPSEASSAVPSETSSAVPTETSSAGPSETSSAGPSASPSGAPSN